MFWICACFAYLKIIFRTYLALIFRSLPSHNWWNINFVSLAAIMHIRGRQTTRVTCGPGDNFLRPSKFFFVKMYWVKNNSSKCVFIFCEIWKEWVKIFFGILKKVLLLFVSFKYLWKNRYFFEFFSVKKYFFIKLIYIQMFLAKFGKKSWFFFPDFLRPLLPFLNNNKDICNKIAKMSWIVLTKRSTFSLKKNLDFRSQVFWVSFLVLLQKSKVSSEKCRIS